MNAHPITRFFSNGTHVQVTDLVVQEEPLELRIEGNPTAVLMRTPGNDLDLCRGFLLTEGVIDDLDDIHAIAHIGSPNSAQRNTVDVRLSSGVPYLRAQKAQRHLFASSSCGICGKESIDRIMQDAPPINSSIIPPLSIIFSLSHALHHHQQQFQKTGGIHAAALFDQKGELLHVEEDVGRHNALDKLIGWAFRHEYPPLVDYILCLSGRAGFELLQKAWMAQIGTVVAIGAPSSLAVELAQRSGIRLYAFLRDNKVNLYTPGP